MGKVGSRIGIEKDCQFYEVLCVVQIVIVSILVFQHSL